MSEKTLRGWPEASVVALATLPTLTSDARSHLEKEFAGRLKEVFSTSEAQLTKIKGIGSVTANNLRQIDLELFEQRMQQWQSLGIRLLHPGHEAYPNVLLKLFSHPPFLFVRGEWKPLKQRVVVGVVGTRTPTVQARHRTEEIVERLVEMGATLISGLAMGIDATAHWAAMRVPDSYQLAILGCGVLQVYPKENQLLAEALLLGAGTLVSEWAPDAAPSRSQLVIRNRTLAAFCGALIVVETDVQGGAMHAARFAQNLGRPVFVADLEASGNHELLRENYRVLPNNLMDVLIAAGHVKDAELYMKGEVLIS